MARKVAITRALPEALATAQRVRVFGGEPIVAPLLDINPLSFQETLDDVQALLFTSANGLRAFAAAEARRDVSVLCVGDATATAARAAGFTDVRSADGDSGALFTLAMNLLDPNAGRVLHISGAHVAGDVAGALQRLGFSAERVLAYEAKMAAHLPASLLQPVDLILFHSARAATAFAQLGAPGAHRITAACLSPAVAEAARGGPDGAISWNKIIVAPRPREDALLTAALAP